MKIQEQILGKADRSRSFHASDGALSRTAAAQLESTTSKDIARMRTELFNKFLEMSNKKHCLYRCVHSAKPPLHAWPVSAAAILWLRDIIIESEYDPMVNHAKAIKYTHFGLRVPPGHALHSSALLSDWHGRYQLHDSEDPLKKDWLKMMDERSMTASAAQRKQACMHSLHQRVPVLQYGILQCRLGCRKSSPRRRTCLMSSTGTWWKTLRIMTTRLRWRKRAYLRIKASRPSPISC